MLEIFPDGEKEILRILSSIFPSSIVLNLCLALEFSSGVQSAAFGASSKLGKRSLNVQDPTRLPSLVEVGGESNQVNNVCLCKWYKQMFQISKSNMNLKAKCTSKSIKRFTWKQFAESAVRKFHFHRVVENEDINYR